ncbi:methylenetetrahydrofolate--tRNA-(uracil(54)-C(5))-methyltransferase (FADH(2)-oxidizing) TrmFO [Truepera radiovictrix]|uniref:Methylenetetrahydrofolate--tRNA-(uracil-5-)-methyltransferase TrmFO n=1 Tax=Truepera radiovictrix (strain DSM 17093 / CIP 108686 / LMG 22925 / RQ-24) TaxID=649638 RepID=D7CUH2_TRURR|nr:methylenetetrahydrofolate--tRNA-(uracil(54)-C(5))-methyltransferase (FADH(2)-oxidizing) TrmFO [Truepera radiovictrix]ADI15757.1 gid protein [Truepera radiovictrix DSM 17093]WMT58616.1 methylenetetrahydrofolate--tRNA-(uracil(54)-C(5))-methyltransferase (FADH(2)-oxidizing) TrmFO [Truepera radiovictrix]
MTTPTLTVIGAGMAGSDAAFAAAKLGVKVALYEMRPAKMTPAHRTGSFAELVCSNSFGGEGEANAKGLLQREMLAAGGLVMTSAHATRVPAGGALAVDREAFSARVTEALCEHPNITVHTEELTELPDGVVVVASGPLTSDALAESLRKSVGEDFLGFYDAAAPVIDIDSIDMGIAYRKGRYDQAADYLNLPFTKEQYDAWYDALTRARQHTPHDWEKLEFFEGCMPIEELARRGPDTPRFGPLKPVGLEHPETGERPYAVAQLRQEDARGQMWSLVGFQTGLKWGDQKEVVRLIPGLQNAEVVRYGVMHRNTYLNAPRLLTPHLNLRAHPRLFVAGVLAGTEGYLESSATGWLAGTNAARQLLGLAPVLPPETSMLGGLVRYLASANPDNFQPMNANWSLVPALPKVRGEGKKERRARAFRRGLEAFEGWLQEVTTPPVLS